MNPSQQVDQNDIKRVAKLLRDNGYSYEQSRYLIAEARKEIGLKPPKKKSCIWGTELLDMYFLHQEE